MVATYLPSSFNVRDKICSDGWDAVNPNRVDFIVDLAYGLMIFVAVVLLAYTGTTIGIAFGLGVLVSYVIHVAWKMARFDPNWMTEEVTENIEETLREEVEEVISQLEAVNDRVDRRPRAEEVEKTVGETVQKVSEDVEETVEKTVEETVEKTVGDTVEKTVEAAVADGKGTKKAVKGEKGTTAESDTNGKNE